jgi:hypothetical protein
VAIAPIKQLFNRNTIRNYLALAHASSVDILRVRFRILVGKALTSLRIPGAIRDQKINDPVTHHLIDIRVGDLFTKISVDGRDYYFHRLTGKFDGADMPRRDRFSATDYRRSDDLYRSP